MKERYEYSLYSPGANYGGSPDFRRLTELPSTGFSSIYHVTAETAQAIEQAGSAKWFKGVCWSERLWLDIDSYEAADEVEKRLNEMGVDYVAYDSGGRGAHFGVLRDAVPSHLLPVLDRSWAARYFPEADLSIYTHLHPFRLPGTKHAVTGRIKTLVYKRGGSAVTLPKFREEPKAQNSQVIAAQGSTSIFDCRRVMFNTVPVENGQRHETLVRLLYGLKEEAGAPVEVAQFWIDEWNKLLAEPKTEEELEKAIRSIYG